MIMRKKGLLAGQSGGPTAVINSSLYGVVAQVRCHRDEIAGIYGMVNGIEGFLKERYWISFVRAANAPYRIDCGLEDVDDICNKEKTVPLA